MTYGKFMAIGAAALAIALSGTPGAANAAEGDKVFRTKCRACHSEEKGVNKVGPSLFGVYGRKAGTADKFSRYVGLKDAKWEWDEKALDAYLTDPNKFVKEKGAARSGMAFKLTNAGERKAVIEYLKTLK